MAATQAQSGSVGAGQMEPDDATSDFAQISFIVRSIIAELDTMQPCKVTAVHPGQGGPPAAAGTVDVQLLVSQVDGDGNAVQQGKVAGLPYFRLGGGAWQIVIDPAVGDFGYVIAAQRDIGSVVAAPGIATPGSSRSYSVSDGIYVGGCLNGAPTQFAWFKSDGTFQITDGKQNVLQSTASGISLSLTGGTGTLAISGNVTATGDITAGQGTGDQVGVRTHKHSGVTTGAGQSGAPVPGT